MSKNITTTEFNGAATKRWAICKNISNNEKYRLVVPYASVELPEEQFFALRRGVHNFQGREQDCGRCGCKYTKTYLCTMDCCNCQFQNGTEFLLYGGRDDEEAPKKKSSFMDVNDKILQKIEKEEEEEQKAKGKKQPIILDATKLCVRGPLSPVEYAEEADDIENIITAVSAMGSVEKQIINMLHEEYKHKEIIDALNIPRSTYYYTLNKIQNVVRQITAIKICA